MQMSKSMQQALKSMQQCLKVCNKVEYNVARFQKYATNTFEF